MKRYYMTWNETHFFGSDGQYHKYSHPEDHGPHMNFKTLKTAIKFIKTVKRKNKELHPYNFVVIDNYDDYKIVYQEQ